METQLQEFERRLYGEEKQKATVDKYLYDVREFIRFLGGAELCKEIVISYKAQLPERFAPAGVNSRLVAINRFLSFAGKEGCRVKLLKIQRQIFANEDREITAEEYKRLVRAAGDSRSI